MKNQNDSVRLRDIIKPTYNKVYVYVSQSSSTMSKESDDASMMLGLAIIGALITGFFGTSSLQSPL